MTRRAILIGLAAFAAYACSFRAIQTVDTNTNVLLSYTLVRERDPYLDELRGDRRPWGQLAAHADAVTYLGLAALGAAAAMFARAGWRPRAT